MPSARSFLKAASCLSCTFRSTYKSASFDPERCCQEHIGAINNYLLFMTTPMILQAFYCVQDTSWIKLLNLKEYLKRKRMFIGRCKIRSLQDKLPILNRAMRLSLVPIFRLSGVERFDFSVLGRNGRLWGKMTASPPPTSFHYPVSNTVTLQCSVIHSESLSSIARKEQLYESSPRN